MNTLYPYHLPDSHNKLRLIIALRTVILWRTLNAKCVIGARQVYRQNHLVATYLLRN